MQIYINGRFLEYKLTGVVRYSLSVLEKIDSMLNLPEYSSFNFCLLLPQKISCPKNFNNIKIKNVGINHGSLWEQIDLLFFSKNGWLLSLASTGSILKKRQLVVLHDAKMATSWKSDARFIQRYFLYLMGIVLGIRLKKIITISKYAKEELKKYFYIREDKITIGYEGYEHIINIKEDNSILEKYNLKYKSFVLAVGGGSAKKNLFTAMALKKCSNSDVPLVISGNIPVEVLTKLNEYNNIIIIGRVSDNELVSLYKNALCLCFPSIAEGFGIPPIEAMALNCPVIVSNRDSLPEVCGNAALYCDPDNIKSLVIQLEKIINNKALAIELCEKGQKNIKRFSWEKTSKIILNELIKIISS